MKLKITETNRKTYEFIDPMQIAGNRLDYVERYLFLDAGVKPVIKNFPFHVPIYAVNDQELYEFNEEKVTGGLLIGKVQIEKENDVSEGSIILITKEPSNAPGENNHITHEYFGHIGSIIHFPVDFGEEKDRLSEAYSRILTLLLEDDDDVRSAIIGDAGDYTNETKVLTERSSELYNKIGKKAIVSLFYATESASNGNTLVDRVYQDEELARAVGILAARYGGKDIGRRILHSERRDIRRDAKRLLDETTNSGMSEYDIMVRYLQNEFSLGETFARRYIDDEKPSGIEELIENKKVATLSRVSSLKWIYAHAGTDLPDHDRGIRLLNHLIGTLENIAQIDINFGHPIFQQRTLQAYSRFLGSGDDLEQNILKYGLTYKDVANLLVAAYAGTYAGYTVSKRKVIYAVKLPLRMIAHRMK